MEENEKKELALQIIDRLKKAYPDADCTLDYDDAWKLLVSVRLAAQCTDERVNVVVQELYREFPDAIIEAERRSIDPGEDAAACTVTYIFCANIAEKP